MRTRKERLIEDSIQLDARIPLLEVPVYSKSPEEIINQREKEYKELIQAWESQGYAISQQEKDKAKYRICEKDKYQWRYNYLKGFVVFYFDGGTCIKSATYLKEGKVIRFSGRGLQIHCVNHLSNNEIRNEIVQTIESDDFLPFKNRKYFIDITIAKNQINLIDFSKLFAASRNESRLFGETR